MVFDCAAECSGESLNKHLLPGPDLTNTLDGALSMFCHEPVGITCDIESMFCQVHVTREFRDLMRFFWWEGGTEYRMMVHLFGATPLPGCTNFGFKKTAQDGEEEFGVEAADFL